MPPSATTSVSTTTDIYALSDALSPTQTILSLALAIALVGVGVYLVLRPV